MLHMINTLKSNLALRRSKRRKFKNAKDDVYTSTKWYYKKPSISDEDLEKIKTKIRTQTKKDKRRYFVLRMILFTLFTLILLYYWK